LVLFVSTLANCLAGNWEDYYNYVLCQRVSPTKTRLKNYYYLLQWFMSYGHSYVTFTWKQNVLTLTMLSSPLLNFNSKTALRDKCRQC